MKTYIARLGFRGDNRVFVLQQRAEPLTQHTRHSPDGHSWGYGGSGPAQLALDLLWDLYGAEPRPGLYQDFKFDVIARFDQQEGWMLTEAEVREWVDAHGGFEKAEAL